MSVSNIELGDLAITAAEGGIGYWAQLDSYRPSRWDDKSALPDDFVFYTLRPDEYGDGTFTGEPVAITAALLRRGLAKLPAALHEPDGPGYLDAAAADVVVQLGVFGELTYS